MFRNSSFTIDVCSEHPFSVLSKTMSCHSYTASLVDLVAIDSTRQYAIIIHVINERKGLCENWRAWAMIRIRIGKPFF